MTSAVRNRSVLRISTRLFIVGLWAVMFGLIMLVIFVQLFGSVSTSSGVATLDGQAGLGLQQLAIDSLFLLYQGGIVTLGIGGMMTAFGGTLIVRAAR